MKVGRFRWTYCPPWDWWFGNGVAFVGPFIVTWPIRGDYRVRVVDE